MFTLRVHRKITGFARGHCPTLVSLDNTGQRQDTILKSMNLHPRGPLSLCNLESYQNSKTISWFFLETCHNKLFYCSLSCSKSKTFVHLLAAWTDL